MNSQQLLERLIEDLEQCQNAQNDARSREQLFNDMREFGFGRSDDNFFPIPEMWIATTCEITLPASFGRIVNNFLGSIAPDCDNMPSVSKFLQSIKGKKEAYLNTFESILTAKRLVFFNDGSTVTHSDLFSDSLEDIHKESIQIKKCHLGLLEEMKKRRNIE